MTRPDARLTRRLAIAALAMFGFGYALIPLYDVFCEVTGLNGRSSKLEAASLPDGKVDSERWVTVEFLANVNGNLNWEFAPQVTRMRVQPGKTYHAVYNATNHAAQAVVGQAIPSVTPGLAAKHFNKIECFCFKQQTLGPGERRQMPLTFVVDTDLPRKLSTVTLSYTFFDTQRTARMR